MEISESGHEGARLRLVGMEWLAFAIPVIRTNERAYPRDHPRHGWSQWPRSEAPGRDALIALIEDDAWTLATVDHPVELPVARDHVEGLIEILGQNRRVAGDVPMVAGELVDQMVAALRAWRRGESVPQVDTGRIEREFAAGQDAMWGRTEWQVYTGGLTRRRAKLLGWVLRLMRVGLWTSELDPRRSYGVHLDVSTAAMLRAALSPAGETAIAYDYRTSEPVEIGPQEALTEIAVIREDLDDFLAHAMPPEPEEP